MDSPITCNIKVQARGRASSAACQAMAEERRRLVLCTVLLLLAANMPVSVHGLAARDAASCCSVPAADRGCAPFAAQARFSFSPAVRASSALLSAVEMFAFIAFTH